MFAQSTTDLVIGKKFYTRARQLVLPNTAYYPVFLSQYELVAHGFWRGFSYGMVVFNRADYLKLPGFDMNKIGWGEEDVELYQQFLNQKSITVIRKSDFRDFKTRLSLRN